MSPASRPGPDGPGAAAAEAAGLFRAIFEQAAVGVAHIETASGRFLRVNQRYCDIVGYSREEMEHLDVQTLTHPDDLATDLANVRRLVAGEVRKFATEKRYRRRDGAVVWVTLSVSPLWQPGEPPLSHIAVAEDITARKQAEEAVHESRERLLSVFRAAPIGIGVVSNRVLTEVNARIVEMTGYSPVELIGQSARILYPTDEDFLFVGREKYRQIAARGTGTVETRWQRKDGSVIDVLLSSTPIDPAHSDRGVTFTALDITERKRAEQALRESEQRYRTLFESNPHPMWVYDLQTLAFLAVNDAAVAHYGYSRAEFLAMTIADIRPPEDVPRLRANSARVGETPVDEAGVWRHRRRDGSHIDVEITSHVLDYQGRRAELVLAHDVTARRRAEAERARLQDQLNQAHRVESVGRLAGGVAHDFNNMLQGILGNVSLALQEVPPGSSALRDDLEEIRQAAERSADLTRQLLAFARKQTIQPRVLDLNSTLEGMLKMLRRLIGEDLDLAWLPGPDLWPVRMDPVQIDQILANLCVNARDAMPGSGRVTIETANATLDEAYAQAHPECVPGDYVQLLVSDTGQGMDEATRSRLFEPFFTTKELGKGTGLGLATVLGIVTQNQGLINVYSEPGHGTTFRVYFPRSAAGAVTPVPEPLAPPQHGRETVLLVEDEGQILTLGRRILEYLGYAALVASTPAVALALAAEHSGPIDLLLTDVVMPGMNGKELRDRLRATRPEMKCLFMSGYTADVIAHRGVLDEGVRFLQKPFTVETLAQAIRGVLDGSV